MDLASPVYTPGFHVTVQLKTFKKAMMTVNSSALTGPLCFWPIFFFKINNTINEFSYRESFIRFIFFASTRNLANRTKHVKTAIQGYFLFCICHLLEHLRTLF